MAMMKAKFDLFVDRDIDDLNTLISNPNVVIEKRRLRYRSRTKMEYEEEVFEEWLEYYVSYTINEDRFVENLFKRVCVLKSSGLKTNSYYRYLDFINSDERDIISCKETYADTLMFAVVEYVDMRDMVNEKAEEDLHRNACEGIVFDEKSGTFISI